MTYFKQIFTLVRKDLLNELRTKEMLSAMLIYAFLVVVIFAFAFYEPSKEIMRGAFPGIIWVGFTFAGILGLNRAFMAEKANDCLMGLLLAPMDRTVIYFGKVIANLIFMFIMEIISLPLFFVLLDYRFKGSLVLFILIIVLGTLGFISVGTFLAALSSNNRTSEMLLPILVFPILVPVLLGAVKATGLILHGADAKDLVMYWQWIKLLGVYDAIFLAVPFILFDFVMEV
jgi:heme exporter protein B